MLGRGPPEGFIRSKPVSRQAPLWLGVRVLTALPFVVIGPLGGAETRLTSPRRAAELSDDDWIQGRKHGYRIPPTC